MTLNDEQELTSGSGGGVRIGRPGKKPDAGDKQEQTRQPDRLRRVVSTTGPERAPDFFCVGGDPFGMTRLWQMLRTHPDVGLPIAPNAKHSNKPGGDARLADLATLTELLAQPAAIDADTARQIATELRLAVGTDRAYLRIFGGMSQQVVGEVSAHPSLLTTAGVRRMQRLAPDAKVMLLLDDPVERVVLTAHAAEAASGEAVSAETTADRARRIAASKQTISAAIERHRVAFGDQLYIAFSTDIVGRPESLLESMATILGIDTNATSGSTGVAVQAPSTPEVTPQVRRELYSSLAEEYAALGVLYPEAVARWRSRQEGLIGA